MSHEERINVLEEARSNFETIEHEDGLELYKEIRSAIFNMFLSMLNEGKENKINAVSYFSKKYEKECSFIVDIGFFHDAYKDNLLLSLELLFANFDDLEKANKTIAVLDNYVKPKSFKTQSFLNSFNKAIAGCFAYILMQSSDCSERLALSISKQLFKIGSDQYVADYLKKVKLCSFENNELPLVLELFLFGAFHYQNVDWDNIKPRAKQGKSISDLDVALKSVHKLRLDIITKYINRAQYSLKNHSERFKDYIAPEFQEKVINFKPISTHIDDELVCVILTLSLFDDDMMSAMMPKIGNQAT